MALPLESRRVLVVGASTGIGRAVVEAAARAGARVAAVARRASLLEEAVDAAASAAGSISTLSCDVRDPDVVERTVDDAVGRLGGLDAVLYTAGINRLAFLRDTDRETWHDLLDTNLVGAALVARAALAPLRASHGRIGFCSSDSAHRPFPALGAYAATKAALETMTLALAQEEPDVHVTRIVIGPTLTGMAEGWDPELSSAMFTRWAEEGRFDGVTPSEPALVAEHLVAWLAQDDPPPELDLYQALAIDR